MSFDQFGDAAGYRHVRVPLNRFGEPLIGPNYNVFGDRDVSEDVRVLRYIYNQFGDWAPGPQPVYVQDIDLQVRVRRRQQG